ncbi:LPD7 domain-containing protein [Sphingobium yanoikuyae]|uniref:LPD7 domain-containing protein n=1 Tax=Sphingobium yanoikuyae TaxID=13690 RepID=UPI001F24C251|nr:LPD7 domain-containing protein [Sphingobium yanoikuyae]
MTMADNDTPATKPRSRANSVAIDDKVRRAKVAPADPAVETQVAARSTPLGPAAPDLVRSDSAKKPKVPSIEAGDLPEAVRKRYYADKAKWSGDPAFFTSAAANDPAFRDQGRRLVTSTESQEVVKDLVAIAQHRGWDKIHVTGSEAFRRSVWLEASRNGLDVRGYKPNERDLQELDRLRTEGAKNTIAPMAAREVAEGRKPASTGRAPEPPAAPAQPVSRTRVRSGPVDRAADSQMRVMEAVIRRTLFDNPEAVTRVMTVARAQLDAHIAAGRTIKPAVVRDSGAAVARSAERAGSPAVPVRQGREHRPPERNRSR